MNGEIDTKVTQPEGTRGLGHDAVVAAVGAATGGVVGPVVQQVVGADLNRPSVEQPPPVVLPPGVHVDK